MAAARARALRGLRDLASLGVGALLLALAGSAWAGPTTTQTTDWQHLSAMQRQALAPLQGEWAGFSADRRRKWLNIASRYSAMSQQQREILQKRMVEWVHMSPGQRRLARENYLATGRAPVQSRRKAWERYQQLSPQQRKALAHEGHKALTPPHVEQYVSHAPRHPIKPVAPALPLHLRGARAPHPRPAASGTAARPVSGAPAAAAPKASAALPAAAASSTRSPSPTPPGAAQPGGSRQPGSSAAAAPALPTASGSNAAGGLATTAASAPAHPAPRRTPPTPSASATATASAPSR